MDPRYKGTLFNRFMRCWVYTVCRGSRLLRTANSASLQNKCMAKEGKSVESIAIMIWHMLMIIVCTEMGAFGPRKLLQTCPKNQRTLYRM